MLRLRIAFYYCCVGIRATRLGYSLKIVANKFSYKSSPNNCCLLGITLEKGTF